MPVAAVDIGTNSTRLLVSEQGADVVRISEVTGLGRGVARTGKLSREGIARTLDALRSYRALIDEAGAERVRAVMTASGRDADDADEFARVASSILGVTLETISGEEEASLSYAGATAGLDDGSWTVVDIGGGSTEIVTAAGGRSFRVGSVRITDLFLEDRPIDSETLEKAEAWIRSELQIQQPAENGVVGVAGTWTSLADMTLAETGKEGGAHHHVLPTSTLLRWRQRLANMSIAETSRLPGLDPARAPVILGGTQVALTTLDILLVDECLVSENDLLDGIVATLG